MNRKERRARWVRDGWSPLEPATAVALRPEQIEEHVAHLMRLKPDLGEAKIRRIIAGDHGQMWKNDRYTVHVMRYARDGPDDTDVVHLSIRRNDREPARDWRDFQRIKNELVGPECEGVELFPAESRVVDTANQFHLWVIDRPGWRLPFGWDAGRFISDESSGGSVQRPRDDAA